MRDQQRRARLTTGAAAVLAAGTLTAGTLAGLAAPAGASPLAKAPSCFGRAATIVVTGDHKHVAGTAAADVIVALGKGDTVYGNGGDDRICVGSAAKVDGGTGDDRISFVAGTILGGAGADILSQRDSGRATIDGGAGADVLTVPKQDVNRDVIAPGAGDVLNGRTVRADAPKKLPDAYLGYGTAQFTPRGAPNAAGQVVGATEPTGEFDQTSVLTINRVLAPVGRSIASWAVNFGDGSPLRTGRGDPPSSIAHAFVTDGAHPIILTLTDSGGGVSRRTLVVSTAGPAGLQLAQAGPAASVTFTPTYVAGTGAAAAVWVYTFSDGTTARGNGVPPAIAHGFGPGGYSASLVVLDDHDATVAASVTSYDTSGAALPPPSIAFTTQQPLANGPDLAADTVAGSTTATTSSISATVTSVAVGQPVSVGFLNPGSGGLTSLDLGDGQGPQTGSITLGTTYLTPGTKTVTALLSDGNGATVTVRGTIVVTPPVVRAELVAPQSAPDGSVTVRTTGTVSPPGALWYLRFGDDAPHYGVGPVPSTFTRSLSAGPTDVQLVVQSPSGDVSSTVSEIDVAGPQVLAAELSAASGPDGTYTDGTAYAKAGAELPFVAEATPSAGHVITGGKLDFGDGTTLADPPGLTSGVLDPGVTAHAYAAPGTYRAVLTVTDDTHSTSSVALTVSVGTDPAVTPTVVAAPAGAPSVLTLGGLSAGANSVLVAHAVIFGDATTPAMNVAAVGYGTPAPTMSHVYAQPGTYSLQVFLLNDHGLETVQTIPVVIPAS